MQFYQSKSSDIYVLYRISMILQICAKQSNPAMHYYELNLHEILLKTQRFLSDLSLFKKALDILEEMWYNRFVALKLYSVDATHS